MKLALVAVQMLSRWKFLCWTIVFALFWFGHNSQAEEETGKRRRQVFREDVSPLLGGKVPSAAFDWSRLMFNNLDSRGISIPDGFILSNDRHPPEGVRSQERRIKLYRQGGKEFIDSTYTLRDPVHFWVRNFANKGRGEGNTLRNPHRIKFFEPSPTDVVSWDDVENMNHWNSNDEGNEFEESVDRVRYAPFHSGPSFHMRKHNSFNGESHPFEFHEHAGSQNQGNYENEEGTPLFPFRGDDNQNQDDSEEDNSAHPFLEIINDEPGESTPLGHLLQQNFHQNSGGPRIRYQLNNMKQNHGDSGQANHETHPLHDNFNQGSHNSQGGQQSVDKFQNSNPTTAATAQECVRDHPFPDNFHDDYSGGIRIRQHFPCVEKPHQNTQDENQRHQISNKDQSNSNTSPGENFEPYRFERLPLRPNYQIFRNSEPHILQQQQHGKKQNQAGSNSGIRRPGHLFHSSYQDPISPPRHINNKHSGGISGIANPGYHQFNKTIVAKHNGNFSEHEPHRDEKGDGSQNLGSGSEKKDVRFAQNVGEFEFESESEVGGIHGNDDESDEIDESQPFLLISDDGEDPIVLDGNNRSSDGGGGRNGDNLSGFPHHHHDYQLRDQLIDDIIVKIHGSTTESPTLPQPSPVGAPNSIVQVTLSSPQSQPHPPMPSSAGSDSSLDKNGAGGAASAAPPNESPLDRPYNLKNKKRKSKFKSILQKLFEPFQP